MVDFVTRAILVTPHLRGGERDSDSSESNYFIPSEDEDVEKNARKADIYFERACRQAAEQERRERMFGPPEYYDYDSDDNCQFTKPWDSD